MKIDNTTDNERNNRQIGITTDHTIRTDKVLFFAYSLILKSLNKKHTQASHTNRQTDQNLYQRAQFNLHTIGIATI